MAHLAESTIDIITNGHYSYAVERTTQGYNLISLSGPDAGKQYNNTFEEYDRFLSLHRYHKTSTIPQHFVESYMNYYQCACVDAILCLISPSDKPYEFQNGRVKPAYQCVEV